jgi:subtilisin family serine protease
MALQVSKGGFVMNRGHYNDRARVGSMLLTVFFWSTAGALTIAEHQWVTPDGHKYSLSRSKTELVVELRDSSVSDRYAQRMAIAGRGKLENLKSAAESRFKFLTQADVSTRRELENDPDVAAVRHVYRYDDFGTFAVSSGTIAIKVHDWVSGMDRAAMLAEFGLVELRPVRRLNRVFIVGPSDPDADEVLIAEGIAGDARTVWANPNFYREYQTSQTQPADNFFDLQWHLQNTGISGGTVGADIDALRAWDLGTGEGVVLGMFDDSCDVDHEDLRDNYIGTGQDVTLPFFDADYNNPRPKQLDDAHGTAVMGLAAASANTLGVRGVAFNAKFTASRGLGTPLLTDEQIASAYSFALDQNVDVHINSWSFRGQVPTPPVLRDAIVEAATNGRDPDGTGPLPPRGMVILFSSGNEGAEFKSGFSVASIPGVIAIGASTESDSRAGYSNFGAPLSLLAPGAGNVNLGVTTTDTEDGVDKPAQGYNVGGTGVNPETGQPQGIDIDPAGKYTGLFGGTSAACPIAAGVAAIILSINPQLAAADVRLILEHTCDQIQPEDAVYDPITRHSLKYGRGRVNAFRAAQAAKDSLLNGHLSWPDSPANAVAEGTTLTWLSGDGTDEFLVLESEDIPAFSPTDGLCYDGSQAQCPEGQLAELPSGVNILFVGCTSNSNCSDNSQQSVEYVRPQVGSKSFFIYARNTTTGRYSFGIKSSSEQSEPPAVTIQVSILEGDSPLTVNFKGNAVSSEQIDESRTSWDFDVDTPPDTDSTTRNATHIYQVTDNETRLFIAKLTMFDVNGLSGSEEVAITVRGQGGNSGGNLSGDLQIVVGLTNTPESNVSSGQSPFAVVLSVDATSLSGTLQAINWDLGDGATSSSLIVPHTYINEGTVALRIPITATVTMATSATTTVNTIATRIITVEPGTAGTDPGDVENCELPGTCASGPDGDSGGGARVCGAAGMLPLMLLVSLTWVRRRIG